MVSAALTLGDQMLLVDLLVVQVFHRQRVAQETGARHTVGDPEVDGAMDRELDDVIR